MGLEMKQPDSSPSSSPEHDISLPDAPPADANPSQDKEEQKPSVKLENLFDADPDDELAFEEAANLLSDSSPPASSSNPLPSSPPPVKQEASTARYRDPQVMTQFYARLFPFRSFFHWLNHSIKPSTDFSHREFSFTLPNEAYLRYQSYPSADLFKRDVLKLIPSRFEIGPVYTANPRERSKSSAFKPFSKEMVFDIDLTDYDDVRTCCDKANICNKCWTFVTMSIKVIDTALREDFAFEHIMWVYSGRRGAHAWVSDKAARGLDDDRRRAITAYLEVIKGGAQGGKRVKIFRPLHPHLKRSLELLRPYFASTILEEQDPFASEAGTERLLTLLPDAGLVAALRQKWRTSPGRSSALKWKDIDDIALTCESKTLIPKELKSAKQDILLEYTYPRLDVEVSKKRNHLLKSPFVVHPGTGRVCVPITSNAASKWQEVEDFDPLSAPVVTDLLAQVDAYKPEGDRDSGLMDGFVADGPGRVRKLLDWEKTDLKGYVDRFDLYVKGVLAAETRVKREREAEEGVDGPDGMEF